MVDIINPVTNIYTYSEFCVFTYAFDNWIMEDCDGGIGNHECAQDAIMTGFKFHPNAALYRISVRLIIKIKEKNFFKSRIYYYIYGTDATF